ncbi:uncharacterized protein MELLADRAFT_67324 [Melampsora larici-populina 98AG31]|uniref:Uncharacterized protein n=1 Tax=Melampsora larici-populina (strain 98AG31 / pathotype 3-4-7) TaxID=747676 RepID=F4S2N8_MELLP|nr:uncharacterized protein MELLADRAFT_67324 [Melampsora larici-populina 98AG31]EGG01094.1 hypothetical protein MELLADRAFT_67324 [Melampsora larici-populina 98AG31]
MPETRGESRRRASTAEANEHPTRNGASVEPSHSPVAIRLFRRFKWPEKKTINHLRMKWKKLTYETVHDQEDPESSQTFHINPQDLQTKCKYQTTLQNVDEETDMIDGNPPTQEEEEALRILKQWTSNDPFGDEVEENHGHILRGSGAGPSIECDFQPQITNQDSQITSTHLPTGAGVTRKTNSRQAGPTRTERAGFLHPASEASSEEERDSLGPILDRRLRPRVTRRASNSDQNSTSGTAGPSQKQKASSILPPHKHTRSSGSDDDDDDIPIMKLRISPRKKKSALTHKSSEDDSDSDRPVLPKKSNRRGSHRRGSDIVRRGSRGGSLVQGRGGPSKSLRVKITPKSGNPLQLRVPATKPQKTSVNSSHPNLRRRQNENLDSDDGNGVDDLQDDDWAPGRDENDDDDEEMEEVSNPRTSSKSKGKARAVNQDSISDMEQELEEGEAEILGAWNERDLLGDDSSRTQRATTTAPGPSGSSDDVALSAIRNELRSMKKHVFSLNNISSSNTQDIRRLTSEFSSMNDLLKHYVGRQSGTSRSTPRNLSSSRQNSDGEESTGGTPSPRSSPQRMYIRKLIRFLLGLKPENKIPLNGATPAERRLWRTETTIYGLLEAGPADEEDADEGVYGSGLVVTDESPNSVKIIQNTLSQAGVKRFRPEWEQPMNSDDNAHLCKVATAIFLKLVRSGEYSGVSKSVAEANTIYPMIVNHMNDTWRRKYRKHRTWSQNRQQETYRAKMQYNRISNVREGRSNYVMARENLWTLTAVVQVCCSDDETDPEADEDAERKLCKIRRLPWRNPQLDKIFDDIDAARERKNPVKGSPGNQPRIRQRDSNNPISKKQAPKRLCIDCYCPTWLDAVPGRREALEVVEQRILGTVKKNLAAHISLER